MKYSLEQLENDISDVITELAEMRKAKGHDYSGASDDNLDNYRDGGWQYVWYRLGEKYRRVKNIIELGERAVKDETVEETLKDNVNLALYALIMYRQEKPVTIKGIPLSDAKLPTSRITTYIPPLKQENKDGSV